MSSESTPKPAQQPEHGAALAYEQQALDYAHEGKLRIDGLVAELGGPDANLEEVLPSPGEVRGDAPLPTWAGDEQAVATARAVAAEFGYGAEQDQPTGIAAGALIFEGGLAWKVVAQKTMYEQSEQPQQRVLFAGSAERQLRPDEREFLQGKGYDQAVVDKLATEYDMVRLLATDMVAHDAPEEDPGFGYRVAAGNAILLGDERSEDEHQVVHLGSDALSETEVYVVRVDRENYVDADGKPRYRHQPDSAALMGLVADALATAGDESTPVGLLTSSTYASRVPDAVRAGVHRGRQFAVGMYGRATMAAVKEEPIKPETPLAQLPGDLHVLYDKLDALEQELRS